LDAGDSYRAVVPQCPEAAGVSAMPAGSFWDESASKRLTP